MNVLVEDEPDFSSYLISQEELDYCDRMTLLNQNYSWQRKLEEVDTDTKKLKNEK